MCPWTIIAAGSSRFAVFFVAASSFVVGTSMFAFLQAGCRSWWVGGVAADTVAVRYNFEGCEALLKAA